MLQEISVNGHTFVISLITD